MAISTVFVGFIPLLDCAGLAVAAEKGFAAAEGLDLRLVRETSWANIRDRTLVGQFDAAQMLGPMPVASTLGVGHVRAPVIAPLALNGGGNAITVSRRLWEDMSGQGAVVGADPRAQGAALKQVVAARERAGLEPLTFAMVYPFSCHNYELRYWLAACGIDPDRDIRLVVIPPPYLADALREQQVDGFCVGEPWNSVAVETGAGVIVATANRLWPGCPEKVLGCRLEFARRQPDSLAALLRALWQAGEWCADPAHHGELADLLAEPHYVGAPVRLLEQALDNRLRLAPETPAAEIPGFITLGGEAMLPDSGHALWYYAQMVRWRQVEHSSANLAAAGETCRADLARAALAPLGVAVPDRDLQPERFFDGEVFEPALIETYLRRPRM